MNPFYSSLLERDADGARAAARAYREEHSSHDLFLAVGRFAVLAYAPSQHAKHAMMATLAAYELREELGAAYDAMLVECAIYSAASRQPWSEPPIMDPPPVEGDEPFVPDDRLASERWLAANYQRPDFAHDYFRLAAEDFEDLGHKLIVANAAWKLAPLLGEQGRFATLRTGVWEMTAYRGERYVEQGRALEVEALAPRLLAAGGDFVNAHKVFLLDAAVECGDDDVLRRVRDHLSDVGRASARQELPRSRPPLVPYNLATDCAATLKAHAVAKRWQAFGSDAFLAAVDDNRRHGPHFDDFAFA